MSRWLADEMGPAARRATSIVERRALEPIVAYGARMSWVGCRRPGDRFPRAHRSGLATLRSGSGPPLQRQFGAWSAAYRRFTLNLSSPQVVVRTTETRAAPGAGPVAVVHWISRHDLLRTDRGGACRGDGWPMPLWERFVSRRASLPGAGVGEQLRAYAESGWDEAVPVIAQWRRWVRGDPPRTPALPATAGWLPLPARIETPEGPGVGIVSWSPYPLRFGSLREALASPEAAALGVDAAAQARYYIECRLARLHGVRFGRYDSVVDRAYERRVRVRRLAIDLETEERSRARGEAAGRWGRAAERPRALRPE